MKFQESDNEYTVYLSKKYDGFTKVNIKFIENGNEEVYVATIPISWLEIGYVAIDADGGVTVFDTDPIEHEFSKTWDIKHIDADFVEVGYIKCGDFNWKDMLQPIGNANFVLG